MGMMNGDARVKVDKTSLYIWWFPKIEENPPKWMVKIMENPMEIHDLGGPPLFLETPIYGKGWFCYCFTISIPPSIEITTIHLYYKTWDILGKSRFLYTNVGYLLFILLGIECWCNVG